ncbi:MAG: imidazole glycerol phosphate synthase subunit HisH [Longimicrobiales bacterium]
MRVTIFDYGAGNLHSLAKGIVAAGADVTIDGDPVSAARTELLVLPGVGAFAAAAARLGPGLDAMRSALADGLPCLGICLGMQLLFDGSDEGPGAGLGVIRGRVTRLRARRVPQIGWNSIEADGVPLVHHSSLPLPHSRPLHGDPQPQPRHSPESGDPFADSGLDIAYYANGYACRPTNADCVIAWSTHEDDRYPAAVRWCNVIGVQFHPEKSSRAGIRFLRSVVAGVRS